MKQVGEAKCLLHLLTKKPQQKVRLYVCMLSLLSFGSLLIHSPMERIRKACILMGSTRQNPNSSAHPQGESYPPACLQRVKTTLEVTIPLAVHHQLCLDELHLLQGCPML